MSQALPPPRKAVWRDRDQMALNSENWGLRVESASENLETQARVEEHQMNIPRIRSDSDDVAAFVPNLSPLAARLACPTCLPRHEAALRGAGQSLSCSRCGQTYGLQGGVPLLLAPQFVPARAILVGSQTGRAMVEEYAALAAPSQEAHGGTAKRSSWLARALKPPDLMLHADPELEAAHTRALFDHAGPSTRVLNLGGGPKRYRPTEVTLNLDAFPNVDVVGDAHCIPFLSDTFDSVICNAVLEHVTDPDTVVAEAIRVLKPGGRLYAEVPFIFFFHGYPSDFRRFTLEGMKLLFRGLESPQFGITHGPVSAALQSVNTLLQLVIPPRARWALKLARGVFGWTLFPLKHLDRRISRREDAHILAGGFYVLGAKPGAGTSRPA
jgi:SAM-dependent methyltransferase/uncharacterized protein YbaR (Trm112 family)